MANRKGSLGVWGDGHYMNIAGRSIIPGVQWGQYM
jgi:hypothetical protein